MSSVCGRLHSLLRLVHSGSDLSIDGRDVIGESVEATVRAIEEDRRGVLGRTKGLIASGAYSLDRGDQMRVLIVSRRYSLAGTSRCGTCA